MEFIDPSNPLASAITINGSKSHDFDSINQYASKTTSVKTLKTVPLLESNPNKIIGGVIVQENSDDFYSTKFFPFNYRTRVDCLLGAIGRTKMETYQKILSQLNIYPGQMFSMDEEAKVFAVLKFQYLNLLTESEKQSRFISTKQFDDVGGLGAVLVAVVVPKHTKPGSRINPAKLKQTVIYLSSDDCVKQLPAISSTINPDATSYRDTLKPRVSFLYGGLSFILISVWFNQKYK